MNVLEEVRELFGMILDHTDSIEHVKMKVRMKNGAHIDYAFDRKKWEKKLTKEQKTRPIKDTLNAVIDIAGITVSISVLVLLIVFSSIRQIPSYIIVNTAYGSILVLYFLFSSIYHFMDDTYATRKIFYMMRSILQFIIVGVTFISICYDFIGGDLGSILYSGIVITGITGLFLSGRNTLLSRKVSAGFLIAMSWLWVIGMGPVISLLGLFDTILVIIACIFYTMWAVVSHFSKGSDDEFLAGNLFLLFSIFPVFSVYMHILGILPL